MNSKVIENYKKNLKLNPLQREIIVGLMLGDGHLETQNQGRTYRLKIEYSENQREYIDWLYEIFKDWADKPPQLKIKTLKSGTIVKSLYFSTYSHGALRFYGQIFYSSGVKIIPKIISKLLTPLGLAIWFMDDGSWKSNHHKTYIIHTDGYKKKDLLIIEKCLKDKFNIGIALHKQYDNFRIYVKTESAIRFKDLIQDYLVPGMKYKLGNNSPKE